ncbi:alkyl sulfatase C-terminal domain-containing protein [Segatella bryantii]|jgi:alkyl sulfatase BDS1-like metallo-beta-lactamase superfamily hydrolase|uniref:alkyl sulfatase C-terminal domain-containing protein n=1 Tax=Segatella bryantii TaxID=77095 RepID=UPI000881E6A0|nr:alkyl sulfatase C-terminal domain-containing protein [Segatella bryantii]SDM00281.1 Alkyl sulfatase C-terminal [Segatella bryantii]
MNKKISLLLLSSALVMSVSDQPDIVLSASKKDIVDLFSRNTKLNDRFTISGNQSDLQSILDLIETPDYYFNIIEP